MPDEPRVRFRARAALRRNAEILDSLLACSNEQGCFQTKVEDVVAKVGIGKGTLYRHYSSREELFKSALHRGIDILRGRCQSVWETHGADPEEGVRAVIGELVSLNRSRADVSPASLAHLDCGCGWMTPADPPDENLDSMLVPLVQRWQLVRLFDEVAAPSLIAAVIITLVNSPAILSCSGGESAGEPQASANLRRGDRVPHIADRLVSLLTRAFPPVRRTASTVEEL